MSQEGQIRQSILVGEILQLKMGSDADQFDAIEAYAKSVLEKYVRMDSPDTKKHILVAVLALSAEVLKLRKELETLKNRDEKTATRVSELLSLLEEGLDLTDTGVPAVDYGPSTLLD